MQFNDNRIYNEIQNCGCCEQNVADGKKSGRTEWRPVEGRNRKRHKK